MNRKKLIPLLLFLLLLLLIMCVWYHSDDIVKNRAINPVVKKDIDFNFVKSKDNLELTGNFSTDKSIQVLHTGIGNTKFNNLSNINKELEPKEGVVSLTQKLLLAFNEHYEEGSISYANGTLTVEGVVDSNAHKDTISTLLAGSGINSQNNTRVVLPGPTAEELAAIKAQEEAEKAKLEAEAKEAEEKAKHEAEAKAQEEAQKAKLEAEAKEAEEKAKHEAEAKAQEEAQKAKLEAEALERKIKVIIDSEHINFEVNKDKLTIQSISTIEQIADILNKHPNINVEISGHTDNTGNADYNLLLSQKRVDSVKEKLIELQIDSHRLTAVGYGANQPLVSNDTKENRHINRRVEFKVIGE